MAFEITEDGGVRITGTRRDLSTLAAWLLAACEAGAAHPAYVANQGLTAIEIVVEDPPWD